MAIRVETLYYDLEMRTDRYRKGLKNAEADAGKFTRFIKENPIAVAGALAASLALVGNKARQMAGDFEHGLREVSTLVDTSVVDMGRLRDGVLDLFRDLPVQNIDDLTRGLYQMISAGVPAERALADLEVATKASIAGVTGVETAVTGITVALNAFSEEGLTAQQVADQTFAAVRLGQTTFEQISGGIGQTAGLAAQLNVGLADLLANMTALTLGGLDTSQAFNAIRQALANVLRPTTQLKEQFPEIATEFNRSKLEAVGLTQFLTELAGAMKGNTDIAVQMFGSVEALNAIMSLTGDGGERLNRIFREVQDSAGAADEAFRKMAEDSVSLQQQFENNVSAAMIEFGDVILPAVNAELKGMIGLFQLLNGTIAEIRMDSAVTQVTNLAQSLDNLTGEPLQEGLKRLREGIRNIAGRGGPLADQDLSRFTEDQLRALRAGISTRLRLDDIAPGFRAEVEALVTQLDLALRRRAVARSGFTRPGIRSSRLDEGGGDDEPLTGIVDEDRVAELMRRVEDVIDQSTASMVDNARRALERFKAELADAGVEIAGSVARAVQTMEDNIAALELAEEIRPQLDEIDNLLAGLFNKDDLIQAGARLQEIEQQLIRERDTTEEGSVARENVNDLLERTRRDQKRVADEYMQQHDERMRSIEERDEAERDAAEQRRREQEAERRRQRDLVDNIERATEAALRFAQALGVVSDETAQVLRDVVDLGSGIGRIAAGDVAGGTFQAAAGLTGLVTGLIGGDPEAKRIREENTRALRDLSRDFRQASQFLGATTGTDIGRLEELSQTILASRDMLDGSRGERRIEAMRLMARLGPESIDLVVQAAKRLGIQFKDETAPSLEELIAAAEALEEVEFERFRESFGGALDMLQREFDLFDIEDPIEQVRRLLELFLEFVDLPSALERELAGLDLSTAQGRAQAEKIIQDLFRQVREGTIDPSMLGGLTVEEFLNQLARFEGLLDQAAADDGTTTQFAVQRSITEVTGSRIAALLTTGVHWQEMTAHSTAEIVRLLGGGSRSLGLTPPSIERFGAAGGPVVSGLTVNVHVDGAGPPEEIGRRVGRSTAEELDRILAVRLADSRRRLGDNRVQEN